MIGSNNLLSSLRQLNISTIIYKAEIEKIEIAKEILKKIKK
jgi:hypothetical protein